jgi:hypothetical protein
VERVEYEAGKDQKLVVYVSFDTGGPIDPGQIFGEIATDAAAMAGQGWRILSTTVMPMRQTGTAGNILFQSGGQYATQSAVVVVYTRA